MLLNPIREGMKCPKGLQREQTHQDRGAREIPEEGSRNTDRPSSTKVEGSTKAAGGGGGGGG